MRIAIFGGTGGTGRHLIEQGLRRGHALTALARNPARLDISYDRLRVMRGDVLDATSVAAAIDGCDAVIASLATTSGDDEHFYAAATDNLAKAMEATGTQRVIFVSAGPLAPDHANDTLPYRLLIKPLIWRVLGRHYRGLALMEQRLHDSDLDWTLLRPPQLTDKPPTGRYRMTFDGTVRRGYRLSRADLAAAALDLLDDPRANRVAVAVAN